MDNCRDTMNSIYRVSLLNIIWNTGADTFYPKTETFPEFRLRIRSGPLRYPLRPLILIIIRTSSRSQTYLHSSRIPHSFLFFYIFFFFSFFLYTLHLLPLLPRSTDITDMHTHHMHHMLIRLIKSHLTPRNGCYIYY